MTRSAATGAARLVAMIAIAVVVVGAGTATAAKLITGADVRNSSLSGADIRNSTLTGADVRNRSLTGTDVRDGSIRAVDLAADARSVGPRGLPGAPGPVGPAGIPGPAGPPGPSGLTTLVAVEGPTVAVAPDEVGSAEAVCPPGTVHVGVGFFSGVGSIAFAERFGDRTGIAVINDTPIVIDITAQAICAQGGAAVRSTRSGRDARSDLADRVAELRGQLG